MRERIPPVVPFSLVRFAARHPLPLLGGGFRVPECEQAGVDFVAQDVFRPGPVEPFHETWETHVRSESGSAWVVGFAGAEVGAEGCCAIGVQEVGSYYKGAVRGGRVYGYDFVAGGAQGGNAGLQGAGAGWGWVDYVVCAQDADA